jgi:2-oxoglutarate dehydrogenase complex dehydrogenase (E1) component-like enzyme
MHHHYAGSPNGSPAKALWQLHEAVEVMAATYCGSLAIEYKHLQQQDEMAWVEQRFESRRPLSSSQKRQVRTRNGWFVCA